jgi:hypothetical protein
MSWVWERFRNTFRISAEDSSDDVDVETVRISHPIENTVYLKTLWLRIAIDGISC